MLANSEAHSIFLLSVPLSIGRVLYFQLTENPAVFSEFHNFFFKKIKIFMKEKVIFTCKCCQLQFLESAKTSISKAILKKLEIGMSQEN